MKLIMRKSSPSMMKKSPVPSPGSIGVLVDASAILHEYRTIVKSPTNDSIRDDLCLEHDSNSFQMFSSADVPKSPMEADTRSKEECIYQVISENDRRSVKIFKPPAVPAIAGRSTDGFHISPRRGVMHIWYGNSHGSGIS